MLHRSSKMVRKLLATLILIMGLAGGVAHAKVPETPEADVRLLLDVSNAVPGQSSRMGVFVTLARGWHVYWKSPGGIGLPTRISLKLPPGVQSKQILWPLPEQFDQAGGMIGYGYRGDFVFLVPIDFTNLLNIGDDVDLRVVIEWLQCSKDVCVPEKVERSIHVRVAKESRPEHRELFAAAEAALPYTLDNLPEGVAVAGNEVITALPATIAPSIIWWKSVSTASVFVHLPAGIDSKIAAITSPGRQMTIEIALSADQEAEFRGGAGELVVVAEVADSAVSRVGVRVPVVIDLRR